MYICVYVYICIDNYEYVYIYIDMHTYQVRRTYVCLYLCMDAHSANAGTLLHTHKHISTHAYTRTQIETYITFFPVPVSKNPAKMAANRFLSRVRSAAKRECEPQTNWMRPAPTRMIR